MKKNIWIHVGMVAAMLVVSLIYFSPAVGGKIVNQQDTVKYEAMVKETKDFHEQTGEYAQWNSAMFSGMPGIQVGGKAPVKSVYQPMVNVGTLGFLGLDRDAGVLFFYLIGFYIALLVLGCNPWVSLVGALAFGLGSYNIIIVEAGHITKAWAMAMMAPILAGMILCLRKPREGKDKWKDWLWGGILFTVALGMQLLCNHIQITYYTIIGAVILGLAYAVMAVKQRYIKEFFIALGILMAGAALSFASNSRNMLVSMEYSKETMRGGNELTVTPDTLYHSGQRESQNNANGLNISYAFHGWSYDIDETYTLLVPGAKGGASSEYIDSKESAFAQKLVGYGVPESEIPAKAPLYWGDQKVTSGPVYFGAIVIFLFLLGMMVVKGIDRWWILAVSLIAILLSWGDHFLWLNEWLFNNLPFYNKLRTPSMALVLANVCMVLLASLSLKHIFNPQNTEEDRKRIIINLYISAGSLVLFILVVLLFNSSDYIGSIDERLKSAYPEDLISALRKDRKSLFISDSWRSIIFILLAAGTIWLYAKGKLKNTNLALALTGTLIVIDLWIVDRRYLNSENFVEKDDPKVTLMEQPYDSEINQQATTFSDTNYRVLDLVSGDPFNDSHPSAFHHQIGGYSAVKMSRYQNLIDFYIWPYASYFMNLGQKINISIDNDFNSYLKSNLNPNKAELNRLFAEHKKRVTNEIIQETKPLLTQANVINMLNTQYVVENAHTLKLSEDGTRIEQDDFEIVIRNPNALGNCWLVNNIQQVDNVNDEILALNDFNPANTAVVNTKEFPKMGAFTSAVTAGDTIWMEHQTPYNPDYLKYHSRCSSDRLAVFSEIYYAPDWRAYIDGQPAEYIRVNYVLRGLVIPAGEHVIEFKNEAPLFHKLDTVTLISSIILVLIISGAIFLFYRRFPCSPKEKSEALPQRRVLPQRSKKK